MTERHRRGASARTRILGWYVLLLAAALVAALLIQRSFMFSQAVVQADLGMDKEVGELRQLAEVGVDPRTGEPFGGDLARIFETYLERNVPLEGEGIFTILDGRPYVRDIGGDRFADTALPALWAQVAEPVRSEVETEMGPVRYLAVPVMFDDQVQGVFVVTVNMAERLEQVDAVVRVGALVYGSIFILASVVAWVAAGAVLRPLRDLSVTAQTITESDLSRRIDVDGDDEIAALARTFNGMLDRLEEAFETQRRFVDDASHELRTPITVIRGQLELLSDDPDERRATMAIVADELDRMSRIVEDLLVLAKSEQPDFVIPRPLDLVEFVESIVAKGNALGAGEVAVEEAPAAVVVADEQRLTQAMMNLVRNALEHTPDGTKVMVGGAREDDRLRLWVTDHGPGIPAAERAHIFDRFARGRAGRRSGEGAGLGLAIVRAIAEAHRGEVDLHSGEGGSTFIITIPQEVET